MKSKETLKVIQQWLVCIKTSMFLLQVFMYIYMSTNLKQRKSIF